MTISDAIINKVNALLNKTVENGCSVEEAATAAKIAQQLLTQHRLTFADLSVETEKVNGTADPLYVGQRSIHWKNKLANILGKVNGCKVYTEKNWGGKLFVRIVGRDSDIQIVRYFFDYLTREIENLCKQAMKNGYGEGKHWSNSFKNGASDAICTRLQDARNEVVAAAGNCTAIVKLNIKDTDVEKWVEANLNLRKAPISQTRFSGDAYSAGKAAGSRINLNKGIESGKKASKLLS